MGGAELISEGAHSTCSQLERACDTSVGGWEGEGGSLPVTRCCSITAILSGSLVSIGGDALVVNQQLAHAHYNNMSVKRKEKETSVFKY